jgi:putative transposase
MGEGAVPIENRALERYKLIEPFLQGARTLASIAGQADVNLRTAQRWVDLYRRNGLEALAQKQRVDRGIKRAMSQKMVKTIEGLALEKPRVPISAIYRELQEFAAKTGERLPSYSRCLSSGEGNSFQPNDFGAQWNPDVLRAFRSGSSSRSGETQCDLAG